MISRHPILENFGCHLAIARWRGLVWRDGEVEPRSLAMDAKFLFYFILFLFFEGSFIWKNYEVSKIPSWETRCPPGTGSTSFLIKYSAFRCNLLFCVECQNCFILAKFFYGDNVIHLHQRLFPLT
jgi:hypothetical protein